MLIKRTLQFLPAQILAPVAQFLSIVIWTYFCSAETIGILTLLAVFQELANKISFAWWGQYTLRYYSEDVTDLNWKSSDIFLLYLAAIQIFISIVALKLWFNTEFEYYFYFIASVYMALRSLTQFYAILSSIRGKAIEFNVYSVSGPVLGLFIGVILLDKFGDNPIYPLIGYIIGESLSVVVYYIINRFEKVTLSKDIIRASFRYGAPLLISGIFYWIGGNAPRLAIEWKMNLAAVGQFAVGFGLGQRAASLVSMLVTPAALPLAMNKMRDEGRKEAMAQLAQNCALLMVVMLPAMAGLYMISGDFIPLIIANEFQENALIIFSISLISGGLFAVIYNYLNHYFLVTANTKPLIYIDLALAALVSMLSIVLLEKFGITGAAIAMAISGGVIVLFQTIFLIYFRDLKFPAISFLLSLSATAIMCVSLEILKFPELNSYMLLLTKIIVGIFVYSCFLFPFLKKGMLLKLH